MKINKKKLEKKFSNEVEYLDYIIKLVDIKIANRDISLSIDMSYFSIVIAIITLFYTFLDSGNNNYLVVFLFILLEIVLIFFLRTYLKSGTKHILKLKNFKRYLENEIENINKI